jgi:hypothetical protein
MRFGVGLMILRIVVVDGFLPSFPSSSGYKRTTKTSTAIEAVEDTVYTDQYPVSATVLFDNTAMPFEYELDDDVTYKQRPCNLLIQGKDNLIEACSGWDHNLQNEVDRTFIKTSIQRCSIVSPTTVITQWNISYVSSSTQWLIDLAGLCNWNVTYQAYNDQNIPSNNFRTEL